jgi:hypothetical protein
MDILKKDLITGYDLLNSEYFNTNHSVLDRLSKFDQNVYMFNAQEINKFKYYIYNLKKYIVLCW